MLCSVWLLCAASAMLTRAVCADIDTKGKETEHESLAEECRQLTDDVNAFIIRQQATMVPSLTAAPY